MKRFFIYSLIVLIVSVGGTACSPQNKTGPTFRMGKQNRKVLKKERKMHRLHRLRARKHKRGNRKTTKVGIKPVGTTGT